VKSIFLSGLVEVKFCHVFQYDSAVNRLPYYAKKNRTTAVTDLPHYGLPGHEAD
jgi:hypothetical protein